MRPFGCPVYVLDPRIHGGKKIPKWDPKSKCGQFLGMSKQHVSMIGLICNLTTGSVTPQYHIVYDELFTTVPSRAEFDQQQPQSGKSFTHQRVGVSGTAVYVNLCSSVDASDPHHDGRYGRGRPSHVPPTRWNSSG